MIRRRTTWGGGNRRRASAPPAAPGYGTHDKDHPAWQADPGEHDYENGDTSQWAEDVHRGPYPDGNPPAAPGYDTDDQDHPAYKRPSRVNKNATFRKKVEKHAATALRVAKAQLGRTASEKDLFKHALNLMDFSPKTLTRMASRSKSANFDVGFVDTGFEGGFADTGFDGGFDDTGFDDGFDDFGGAEFDGDMGDLDSTFDAPVDDFGGLDDGFGDDGFGDDAVFAEDMEDCASCHSAEEVEEEEVVVDEEKEQLKEAVRSMYAKLIRLQKIARTLVAEEEDAGLEEVTEDDVEEAKEAAEDAEESAEEVAEEAEEAVEEAEEAVEAAEEIEEEVEESEEDAFDDSDVELTALFNDESEMDAMAGMEADDELLSVFADDLSDSTMAVFAKQKPQPKKASKGPKTLGRLTRTASAKDDSLASLWDAPSRDAMDQMKRIFGK